jgi:NADPH-dependent curcumin reductase CurA
VREVGYDAAFDYHDGPAADLLAEAAPHGIDVFVVGRQRRWVPTGRRGGGPARVRPRRPHRHHRPVQQPRRAAPRFDYADIVEKSLRVEGFLVSNYRDVQEKLYELAAPHLRSGRLALDETVVDGIEHIVDAFLGKLRGQNTGKTIVRDHASPT